MANKIEYRHLEWVTYEVVFPILGAVSAWAIARFLFDLPHSFHRVVASGDMLFFASMLVLGAVALIYKEHKPPADRDGPSSLDYLYTGGMVLAIVLLMLYGICKPLFLRQEWPAADLPISEEVRALTTLSVFAPLTAMAFCAFCFGKVREHDAKNFDQAIEE